MASKDGNRDPDDAGHVGPEDRNGMDPEAKEYLKEIQADEEAARKDWADDGECVDSESTVDPFDDLPEIEIIISNIYDM